MEETKKDLSQKRNHQTDAICILVIVFLAIFCIGSRIIQASDMKETELRISALEEELSHLERTQAALKRENSSLKSKISYSDALNTSTPEQDQTSPADTSSGRTIYATATGEKYHYTSSCGRGNYYECTWKVVEERGLEPCKKCVLRLPQE